MNENDKKEQNGPTWKNRRRVIFGSLFFCALTVICVLIRGNDTKIAETAITMSFFMAMSVIGSYVFGAVWQDVKINGNPGE